MSYAWETSNNEADRMATLAQVIMNNDALLQKAKFEQKAGNERAAGNFLGDVFKIGVSAIFD